VKVSITGEFSVQSNDTVSRAGPTPLWSAGKLYSLFTICLP